MVPAIAPPSSTQVATPAEPPPAGRLPTDVRPTRYNLVLELVPDRDRFAGTVEIAIDLAQRRDVIWMHGKGLTAKQASVRPAGQGPVPARFEQMSDGGVAALRLTRPVGPGKAVIRIDYEAAFGTRLEGIYKVKVGSQSYAFTQLQSIYARQMFPGFDEPTVKTPFDVTLYVQKDHQAIANTRAIEQIDAPGGLKRVTFAPTEPLPSYLIAVAIGPLDVVEAPAIPANEVRKRALPLRGVAAKGRGPELAYALANTGAILTVLERYFGVEYPYDKLDLIAVPDKNGAMENPGAITFREWLVLLDDRTAPFAQKRAYAGVMAHELAHMWFGDLVTMPWWDDIWLNEAFATWMASKTVQSLKPEYQASVSSLESIQNAMGTDSLVSARQIRQEVRDNSDILNAFDGITYQKGGGVLGMFERWIGVETFRQGIAAYMQKHRHGSATADDLMAALSAAAKKDVGTPFRTFLQQPGLPFVEASLKCTGNKATLELRQSRFLPLGSTGNADQRWQIPVCARYPSGATPRETCTLLTEREGSLPLDTTACPAWVMPNAEGAGYYRWALPAADLAKLTGAGWAQLSTRERMSVADSVRAGFSRGTTPVGEVMTHLSALAKDQNQAVATAPMGILRTARDWLADDPLTAAVDAHGRKLYAPAYRDLGWGPAKGKAEQPERQVLRQEVIGFLAQTARDPAVRKEAAQRGKAYLGYGADGAIHPEAVDSNLASVALAVAGEEADVALFDALVAKLASTSDEMVRGRLLGAISAARNPELAARARALTLDPRLKVVEVMTPLGTQLAQPETREAAWKYFVDNLDAISARLPPGRSGGLPWMGSHFCDATRAQEVERIFAPRMAKTEGAPRNLAGALETIRLCAARKEKHLAGVRAFFQQQKGK